MRIPKLGWVRRREAVRFVGKVLGGTISRSADRWFLSVTVEMPDPPVVHRENQAVVGVDRWFRVAKPARAVGIGPEHVAVGTGVDLPRMPPAS